MPLGVKGRSRGHIAVTGRSVNRSSVYVANHGRDVRDENNTRRTLCSGHQFRNIQIHDVLQSNTIHYVGFALQCKLTEPNVPVAFSFWKISRNYSFYFFFFCFPLTQRGIMLGNFQFLYFDFILTTSLAIVMGDIKPTEKIHTHRPLSKILTPKNLIPLFMQLFVCALIQRASLYYLELQNW